MHLNGIFEDLQSKDWKYINKYCSRQSCVYIYLYTAYLYIYLYALPIYIYIFIKNILYLHLKVV